MDAAQNWQRIFEGWPASMPKQGMLATTFGEVVTFINFMTTEGILLIELPRPDSNDARKIMIAYSAILAVKSSTTADFAKFKDFGFN